MNAAGSRSSHTGEGLLRWFTPKTSGDESLRGYEHDWRVSPKNRELYEQIIALRDETRDEGLPSLTARDYYYEMLGRYGQSYGYKKGKSFERRLYRLLTLMRRSGALTFSDVRDESYAQKFPLRYRSPASFYATLRKKAHGYYKDMQANQPTAVMVFAEGAGSVSQFFQLTYDYSIPVFSPGGWDSVDIKYQTARRIGNEWRTKRRPTVILHAGDLDPDGVFIYKVLVEEVVAFLAEDLYGEDLEEVVTFKRIMITPDQVPEHGRTPFDSTLIKEKNHRGKAWRLPFTAELQALPLADRLDLLRDEIETVLDLDQLSEDREVNAAEYREVNDTILQLSEGTT